MPWAGAVEYGGMAAGTASTMERILIRVLEVL